MSNRLLCTLLILSLASIAAAQPYPNRPIRFIVPFPPGGGNDAMARIIGQKFTDAFGQQVVIDNRGGAAGNIGTEIAARAAPDGYTLMLASSSTTITPSLYKKLSYVPLRDFQGITQVATMPNVLVIHPSVPAHNMKELVALAKASPGKLSYGSGGVGSGNHLASELFKSLAKIDLVHVPYKGASIALTHILSGEIDVVTVTVPATIPFINGGRLRGLAVLAKKRQPTIPGVPTSAEQGYPELLMDAWYGVIVPAGVRADIIERLNSELVKIMHPPEIVKQLAKVGIETVTSTPAAFQAFLKTETEKWARVIREAKIRVE